LIETKNIYVDPNEKKLQLHEKVLREIWNYIDKNNLMPGDSLPTENELAEVYGVSRNTVREACRVLQTIGILQSSKRVGMVIKEFTLSNLSRFLPYTVHTSSVNQKNVLEARYFFETSIVPYVIAGVTEEDLQNMYVHIREMINACINEDVDLFLKADMEFHREYFKATHNEILVGFGNIILSYASLHATEELVITPPTTMNMILTLEEHKKIHKLLSEKDEANLTELIRAVYKNYYV